MKPNTLFNRENFASITIASLGGLGDGIANLDGKPIFVEKSTIGDELKVRITHETKEALRGEIVEVIKGGPDRAQPICEHFSACGGCSLQQLSNESYRVYKKRVLASAFAHAGYPDVQAELIFLPLASRRRVELKFDGKKFAYYASRSRDLVVIEKCPILEPELQKLLSPISEALAKWHAARAIKTVSLTAADSGIDMVIECSSIVEDTSALEKMAEELNIARISMTTPDKKDRMVANRTPVTMRLGKYDIALAPGSFLQASKEGQRVLTDFVTNAAKDSKSIADLFAGIGTYSFALSQHVKRHAVESDIDMVKSLKAMSHLHGLNRNLSAEVRDLFTKPLTTKELAGYDAIIINPPRPGAKTQVLSLAYAKPPTIIMVSCNPASFARDARMLKDAGYKITAAQGLDQFVMSPHLEIMAVFTNPRL